MKHSPCVPSAAVPSAPHDRAAVLVLRADAMRDAGGPPDSSLLPSGDVGPQGTMTGLPAWYRAGFDVRNAAQRAAATGMPFALFFVDVDHLNDVNDSFGHRAGNEVLRVIAGRLRATAGARGVVAHAGGGEFMLLVRELRTAGMAERFATRMREALALPLQIGSTTLYPSACVGIACHPGTAADVDEVAQAAEVALHVAKSAGRNKHRVYGPAMRSHIREALWMQSHLNVALMRRQFLVLYQPKFDVATGRVAGMEALLRWEHPERGRIPPLEFIPCAEETGHIVALGGLILQSACVQARQWLDAGLSWPVAVNLSPRQFGDPHLLEDVGEALSSNALPPALLQLEVTESCLLDRDTNAREIIVALRSLGVSVHLDDFGTGYSSLARLGALPFDALKIDPTFTAAMASDPRMRTLVKFIVAIARELGMGVIAEGVETEVQRDLLLGMGCTLQQGFLFAHPMSAEAATARFAAAAVVGA